jgi:hypothetical protein
MSHLLFIQGKYEPFATELAMTFPFLNLAVGIRNSAKDGFQTPLAFLSFSFVMGKLPSLMHVDMATLSTILVAY